MSCRVTQHHLKGQAGMVTTCEVLEEPHQGGEMIQLGMTEEARCLSFVSSATLWVIFLENARTDVTIICLSGYNGSKETLTVFLTTRKIIFVDLEEPPRTQLHLILQGHHRGQPRPQQHWRYRKLRHEHPRQHRANSLLLSLQVFSNVRHSK